MKSLVAVLLASAMTAAAAEPTINTPPPVETRLVVSLLARDQGFDTYWTSTNLLLSTKLFLRTSFDAEGTQQGPPAGIGGFSINTPVTGISGPWQAPIAATADRVFSIDRTTLNELWPMIPRPGRVKIACGPARCVVVWNNWDGLGFGTTTDLQGNPLTPTFALPPFMIPHSLIVTGSGALIVRFTGGELRATSFDFGGNLLFDRQLARGLLHYPAAAADDDGSRFVIAWVDSAAVFAPSYPYSSGVPSTVGSNAVRATAISYTGVVTPLAPFRTLPSDSGGFGQLALAWDGRSHLLVVGEYPTMSSGGGIVLWRLDRETDPPNMVRVATIATRPCCSANVLDAIALSSGFAVTWNLGTPMVAVVSSSGEMSTPVPLNESPHRHRTVR